MEILSPAGSFEAMKAAVFAGANAVYFGGGEFNARENASNFSEKEIFEAVLFCHERGVKCFAAMNTLIRDREFAEAEKLAETFCKAGIDAFIVQDTALADFLIKNTNVPVHASTQLTVHTLDGAEALYDAGFKRIVLSRELSKEDIAYIVRNLPDGAEIEIFVHGALCMCYSGQCYMSGVIGKRSGNRGRCAQPCRLPYQNGYTLSLKDLSLLNYVSELKEMGVASLKIEGRMKSPEYVYSVTKAYAEAASGMPFFEGQEEKLAEIFSRNGFTKGYFENRTGKNMFGTKSEPSAKISYEEKEPKRFSLDISLLYKNENALTLRFSSSDGYSAEAEIYCEKAKGNPTTVFQAEKSLTKLGNTVYELKSFAADIPEDLFISVGKMNKARRACIESLSKQRCFRLNSMKSIPFSPMEKEPYFNKERTLRGVFLNPGSIPKNAGKLETIWLPLTSVSNGRTRDAVCEYGEKIGFFLPRIFHDREKNKVRKMMSSAEELGVGKFLCGNVGQLRFLENIKLETGKNFEIHGDFGLNIYNSRSYALFREKGIDSAVLSFELPYAALKAFSDGKSGIIAYGRLPFMIMRNCVKQNHGKNEFLTDRRGKKLLLTCDFGCRNSLWNADVLYLADKELSDFGFLQLLFTDETKEEAENIINEYSDVSKPKLPEEMTRGLYF